MLWHYDPYILAGMFVLWLIGLRLAWKESAWMIVRRDENLAAFGIMSGGAMLFVFCFVHVALL